MAVTKKDLRKVIKQLEDGDYTCYFYMPDFERPSGGIKVAYDHVKAMNENGYKAVILHSKPGFRPVWMDEFYEVDEKTGQYKGIPVKYLGTKEDEGEKLEIKIQDFFFIPEGMTNIMENLIKQGVPCKKVVFCQNWYYVLNALQPGVYWNQYGISDCLSVSNTQSEYLKMIMPFLKIKNVVGSISNDVFYPPENLEDKKLIAAFIPSRFDNGVKSHNVIKTFYAMFPHFRFIQFRQITGLSNEEYSKTLRESAFYIHFDEYSSWGTAPIEAFLSKCLVAGWDGVGGREYMSPENMWIVPNGDVIRLALAMGNMIEEYLMDNTKDSVYSEMESATLMYTKEAEKDSIIKAHQEYREERIAEIEKLMEHVGEENAND